ncbi:tether containing UBX domain for GLUT4-like [Mytilus californianus]|uniref:tether containing UBX domain for GLUT4-like n=1 Tax=Mytilus californianus TaxID=6549 RepID=UPI0022473C7F|nr:tether containing UBX domain for GLUT4-like [Mytilus californianus]
MATVQVLCPNGRRQNVKITPNTKLLQVLEEVCKKQGFLPPEDFNLIHGRKTLDVTLSVRFANLPNNCKLELVKSEKSRVEQEVVIALQLENGERLQGSFSPTISLWELLLHWENKSESLSSGQLTSTDSTSVPPTHPVCIYMREEVIGEMALKETSLRKLGLTGGKAAIRYAQRPVEDSVLADIISKLEKEQVNNARLEQIAARQNSQSDQPKDSKSTEIKADQNVQSNQPGLKPETTHNDENVSKQSNDENESKKSQSKSSANNSEPMETDSSEHVTTVNQSMDVDRTENTISDNIVTAGSRNLSQNGTDRRSQAEAIRRGAEALRNMNIPGVEVITPDDFYDLTPREQQVARQMAAAYMSQIGVDVSQIRQGVQSASGQRRPPQQQSFQGFKFPEETKGKDLYQNELSSVNKEEYKPCDRETMIFSMDEVIKSTGANQEISEDFFEVTEKDVRTMMQDLQKKNEEEQLLMTQSMRRQKLEEQYNKYERVVIRIQFADKLVLQGLFRPRETVFAIKKYVKSYLEDKDLNFYLYTAPPKKLLKDNAATMIEAKLAPACVVYFGVEENKVSEHYLSRAVLKEVGSRIKADEVVSKCFPKEDTPGDENTPTTSGSSSQPNKRSAGDRPRQPRDTTEQKPGVPKWFKVGKK